MYLSHFHLVEKPFDYLIPNPRYFWYTPQGEGIKAQCDYIIQEKSGHLYISGPIGAGKTTLLKTLTQGLLTDNHNIINFVNAPNLKTSNALLRRVSEGFNVKTERSYDATLQNFTTWLKQTDRFPILIIDEAQNLVLDSLKTIHYFMTYVTDRLLMMVILCGQEEMVERINRFTAIRSRMFPAFLSALSRPEAERMMGYRWKIASKNETSSLPFTHKAIDEIFNYSKGVPRAICQVADVCLLAAYNQQKHEIDDGLVRMVVNTLVKKEGGEMSDLDLIYGTKSKTPPAPEKPILQAEHPSQQTPERENARTPVRPSGKRIITRNSFEIYEDQMDSLRKLSLQEKMGGEIGSMSQMVREAIDTYLHKRTATK